MRPVRVLFLNPTLTVGGAERQLALLVAALRDRGVASAIVTLKHEGRFFHELRADGFPVYFAGMRSRADVRGARRALSYARTTRPAAVVTQSIDAQVIGHAIARRLRVPHLTVEHAGPGLRRALHRRLLLRLIAPRIDRVVAVTRTQLPGLAAFGFPASRITVIPNGTAEPAPARERDLVRAELGAQADDVVLLMAATLRPEKRAALFVEAVAEARRRGAPVRGVIAGGGPELERTRARAAVVGGTILLGERSDVADLISAADIVCLTSVAEGLPMIALEAMALGRPVISTAVGGISEAVTPETGRLVGDGTAGFAEAIVELAGCADVRQAMGRAARERYLERYTVDRMADAYLATLQDLVERSGRPAAGRLRRVKAGSRSP